MTTTLVYTGDPCTDCSMEQLFYGSCSKALSDACAAKKALYTPPASTTGGAGSVPAPTVIPGTPARSCGSCRLSGTARTSTAAASVGGPAASQATRGCPWWCYVLAAMILAGVVQKT